MGDPNSGPAPLTSVDWLDQMATDALNEIERMHVDAQADVAGGVSHPERPGPQSTTKESPSVVWPDGQTTEDNAVATAQEQDPSP